METQDNYVLRLGTHGLDAIRAQSKTPGFAPFDFEAARRAITDRSRETSTGCWELQCEDRRRYPHIWYAGAAHTGHRLSFVCFHGPIPPGHEVLHACDNTRCVNPAHLRSGTHADNMAEAVERDRMGRKSKLSRATIDSILTAPETENTSQLSRRLGVDRSYVSKIRSGKRVPPQLRRNAP